MLRVIEHSGINSLQDRGLQSVSNRVVQKQILESLCEGLDSCGYALGLLKRLYTTMPAESLPILVTLSLNEKEALAEHDVLALSGFKDHLQDLPAPENSLLCSAPFPRSTGYEKETTRSLQLQDDS